MFQIGIIGPESTGKSTLAAFLHRRYGGELIPEYARDYIENLAGQPYTFRDIENIARFQIATMEYLLVKKPDIVVYDTELIITKIWFLERYNACPQWLSEAILAFPMDVYLLCYPDIQWEWQPVRENGDDAARMRLFNLYENEIQKLNLPYYIIRHVDE